MSETLGLIALVLCCLIAVAMTSLRLPGTWLIVAGAAGYGWCFDWQAIGGLEIVVLGGIAIAAEVIEIIASFLTARRAGASRRAGIGGLVGGILGMFFLSFLGTLPVPIIGTMVGAIVGAIVGCFGGAMVAELSVRRDLSQGTKVGLFSAAGMILGMVTKIALSLVMSAILIVSALLSLGRIDAY